MSPDTDTIPHNVDGKYQPRAYEYCAGYQHKDSSIVGFSHTHFSGTGHSDLGDILIMPATGELKLNPGTATDPDGGYRSRFSHDTEVSRPGYYEVMLADYGVKAQLTATKRVGVHKYTFPKEAEEPANHFGYDSWYLQLRRKSPWTNIWSKMIRWSQAIVSRTDGRVLRYFILPCLFSKPVVHYGCEEKAKVNYRGGHANSI